MSRRLAATLAAAALCLAAREGMAQQALYGAQPPKGAAFVRFVNATGAPVEVKPGFVPVLTLGTGGSDRVTPYAVVAQVQNHSFAADMRQGAVSTHAPLVLAPGSFNTVIVTQPKPDALAATAIVDGAEFNQARARLSFYNAAPGCAAAGLVLMPAAASVFADVDPGASKTRSVNPVKASVRGVCGGTQTADAALDGMEAGTSFSVWLIAPAGQPMALVTRDTTAAYKP